MNQTMIVTKDRMAHDRDEAIVVTTPLDAIMRLEKRRRISTVVLAGVYARDRELAAFLGEFYPSIRVEREV